MGSGAGDELRIGAAARPALGLLSSLQALLDELDPGQLPARDAADVVRVFDRIERLGATGKALAAGQVAESSLWSRSGHKSPAHWMAHVTGVGVGDAVRLLKTAEAMSEAPVVKDALVAGALSPRQANALAKVEKVAPGKTKQLLDRADSMSMAELETESNRIVAAESGEADAERAARHHKARSLRTGVDSDGMGWGHWKLPPLEHGQLIAALEGSRSQVFEVARRSGVRETTEAYAADALVGLARHVAGRTSGAAVGAEADGDTGGETDDRWSFAKVIVRVDAGVLDRGAVGPGEVCEIAGQGPIPVVDAWKVIDGGALVAAITTKGTDIDAVVHLGRRPTALQRTALEWMTAGTCVVRGCDSVARQEIDHVTEWAATHRTELRELAAACGHHHDLKTHRGYRFGPLEADGKRQLIPPDEAGAVVSPILCPAPRQFPDPPPAVQSGAPQATVGPRSITDAQRVAERAESIARSRAAHPSQRALFDTG